MATDKVDKRNEVLGNRDLAALAYQTLVQKYPHQEVDFQGRPPEALIADDGDAHSWGRARQGWMHYDQAAIVTVGDKTLALVLGQRTEGYAAADISFDLKAFPFDPVTQDLREVIGQRPFFQDTLLVGLKARGIMTNDDQLKRDLEPKFGSFVAQKPKLDDHFLNIEGLGPPMMKTSIRYKPEFAQVVADAMSRVLER